MSFSKVYLKKSGLGGLVIIKSAPYYIKLFTTFSSSSERCPFIIAFIYP